MKCLACDCFLRESELNMKKEDGSFEDMCTDCRRVSYGHEYMEIREYQFQHLTEMIQNYFYMKNIQSEYD
jgi:hypothetical protein